MLSRACTSTLVRVLVLSSQRGARLAPFAWDQNRHSRFAGDARHLWPCLLYTSPSPRDRSLS
eukprot:5210062-Pyramimonas_sp.AAC.1